MTQHHKGLIGMAYLLPSYTKKGMRELFVAEESPQLFYTGLVLVLNMMMVAPIMADRKMESWKRLSTTKAGSLKTSHLRSKQRKGC